MNFNKKQKKLNDLIFFGAFHLLIWLISYFLLGWRGILIGFLVNCLIDTGILMTWIWQEKKQLSQKHNLTISTHRAGG